MGPWRQLGGPWPWPWPWEGRRGRLPCRRRRRRPPCQPAPRVGDHERSKPARRHAEQRRTPRTSPDPEAKC
eukprot:10509106-Alexandrium_andersonii.AAC.1